jgi:L-rhamnose isomerase
MALFEEQKSIPWSAVWEFYCASRGFPVGIEWLDIVRRYEATTLNNR